MNYENTSDFEINREVSIALGHAYDGRGYVDGADGIYHVAIQWGRRVELPDYCKNPSDAWPIICESRICVMPRSDSEWQSFVMVDGEITLRALCKTHYVQS